MNKQFRSVIQWDNPQEKELFLKFTDSGDEIKNASKLILQPGQGCILTYEGKVEAVFSEPGMYDLKSDNIPFVTTIKKFLKLQDGSEHVVGIWFYRKADILNMRWGTKSPVAYTDPVYTFPINLSIFGNYSVRINDPSSFFENVIAGKEFFYHDDLKEIFLSRITQQIINYLAKTKFSYVDIDSNLNKISSELLSGTETIFKNLGFEVIDYRIEGTMFDKDTLSRISKISDIQAEVLAAKTAGINYTEHQKLQAMRDAANNEGPAGMLLGMNIGNTLINTINEDSSSNSVSKMKKLKEMLELELITQEEYSEKKKNILESI